MNKSQSGFTLIELVVVIVLLGILGVTALGKFQDLSGEAETAAVAGVASELSSAAAINYAKGLIGTAAGNPVNNTTASTTALACGTTLLQGFFSTNTIPSGYTTAFGTTTAATNPACDAAGNTYTCTVSNSDATATATATVICTGG